MPYEGKMFSLNKVENSIKIYEFKAMIARNVSIDIASLLSIFPTGDYKLIVIFLEDDKATPKMVVDVGVRNVSPIKDTFG